MPEVSIFLTSYNHGKFLRECIDSVLAQTYSDFELLIWDDASTDDSWQIISSYKDSRIRTFRNKTPMRGGMNYSNAIERGLLYGNYIAMHHSDDAWLPEKLEKQMAVFKANPELASVFTLAEMIDENSLPFTKTKHAYSNIFDQPNRSRHEWLRYFFENANALCHPSVLHRKEVVEKYGTLRPGLAALGDLDMWVRICMHHEIHVLQEKLTKFRVRDNQANSSSPTEENFNRHRLNQFFIYDHYSKIDDFQELVKIFPEAAKWDRGEHTHLKFALAMVFLFLGTNSQAYLWAYTLLFNLLQDKSEAQKLSTYYNFDYNVFFDISGSKQIFFAGNSKPKRKRGFSRFARKVLKLISVRGS